MAVSKDKAKRLQRNGAVITKKKKALPEPVVTPVNKIDTSNSSEAMKAAIRAADAAVRTAQVANGLMKETVKLNEKLVKDVINVVQGNQVTKLVINRSKDKLMKDVELIREKD